MDTREHCCYIFGSGEYGPEWPDIREGDLVIAADGGYRALTGHGAQPHLVVGDFDSLGYVPPHPHIVRHPVMKDDTDTGLALEEGWARGFRRFGIYGGLGGRLDHTLANLQLLAGLACRGGVGFLVGADTAITALTRGRLDFDPGYAGVVSVFCHGDRARGVTLTGLKYSLSGAELTGTVPLGVSNEFTGAPAAVAVEEGVLLVVWRHQPQLPLPQHQLT